MSMYSSGFSLDATSSRKPTLTPQGYVGTTIISLYWFHSNLFLSLVFHLSQKMKYFKNNKLQIWPQGIGGGEMILWEERSHERAKEKKPSWHWEWWDMVIPKCPFISAPNLCRNGGGGVGENLKGKRAEPTCHWVHWQNNCCPVL